MKYNRKGFTMIEILVVIVVIGILFAISASIYAGIQNDTEATGIARHTEGLRKSLIAAALKEERDNWWSEDELESCSTGSATEAPYLDEITSGCNNLQGLVDNGGNITYRGNEVRLRYDNDSNAVLGTISECGNSDTGVNIYSDSTVQFTDDFLERVDDVIDGADGNDCGRFRWDTDTKQISYKLSINEAFLQ